MEQFSKSLGNIFEALHDLNAGLLQRVRLIENLNHTPIIVEPVPAQLLNLRNTDTLPTLTKLEVIKTSELIHELFEQMSRLNDQLTTYTASCGLHLDDLRTSILSEWQKYNAQIDPNEIMHDSFETILSCVDSLCEGLSSIVKQRSRENHVRAGELSTHRRR